MEGLPRPPPALKEVRTTLQARSRHKSTYAPSVSGASIQRRTGRWEETAEVDIGPRRRGGRIPAGPSTQLPPDTTYPLLHTKPQDPPSQVAAPLDGAGHGAQSVPQVLVLAFETHAPPHRWNPVPHDAIPHVLATHDGVPFATSQFVAHVPQWAGSTRRSVSHPFDAWPSQSPKPAAHDPTTQLAPTHAGTALRRLQARAQAPQFAGVSRGTSHPLDATLSQFPKPLEQMIEHCEPAH